MRTIASILLGLVILWLGEEVQESALVPENAIPSISAIDEEEKGERMMDDIRTEHITRLTKEEWKAGFTVRKLEEHEMQTALSQKTGRPHGLYGRLQECCSFRLLR